VSDLNDKELQRYKQLSELAKNGKLGSDLHGEWNGLANRYAAQLEREGREFRARRGTEMQEFFAERKAHDEAKRAYEDMLIIKKRELQEGETLNDPGFHMVDPGRDFNAWLARKGKA
jgi:hypothetical protein